MSLGLLVVGFADVGRGRAGLAVIIRGTFVQIRVNTLDEGRVVLKSHCERPSTMQSNEDSVQ